MLTPEQLEQRRKGIGSSDAAAILGLDPWKTRLMVWAQKTGVAPDTEMNQAMEWGHRLEPVIVRALQDKTGWGISKCGTYTHDEYPFLMATPDRFNSVGDIVEIKTSRTAEGWGPDGSDEVPLHYWIQCQHQMCVLNGEHKPPAILMTWLVVLIGGSDFRKYPIPYDPSYYRDYIDELIEFWDCVVRKTPPCPDWTHEKTPHEIATLYNPEPGKSVVFSDNAVARDYLEACQKIKELEVRKSECKAILLDDMAGAEEARLGDGTRILAKKRTRKAYKVEESTYLDFRIIPAKLTSELTPELTQEQESNG